MDSHSRVTQAERTVGAIRFFLYIRFFLNAPLDLLLVVLTFRGPSLFTLLWWVPLKSLFVFQPATLHFKIVRRLPPTLCRGGTTNKTQ